MSLTALQPLDPSSPTFRSDVDTFFRSSMPNFVGEANLLAANLNSIAAGGAYAIPYTVVSGTPWIGGGGHMCFNDSSAIYLDTVDARGAGVASLLNTLSASSSTVKGTVKFTAQGDPTRWIAFNVLGYTPAGNGLYGVVAVSFLSSSNGGGVFTLFNVGNMPSTLGDSVLVEFQRTGDKGDTGPVAAHPILCVRDEKASNTAPQSLSSGWNTRQLNSILINEISGASVVSNTITLPAGTYELEASAGAQLTYNHKIGLYSVTDSGFSYFGTNERAAESNASTSRSVIRTKFQIGTAKQFQIRHYASTGGGYGGYALSNGDTEIYTEVWIRKVA